jgi:ATP-binding protein involved in chromosome partitioning
VSERPAKHIVAVGSGKGGVGKSTVSLHVALALARRDLNVGLLDADVYGPDIPLMLNLTRREDARSWDFWRRGEVRHQALESHGIRVMSVGFLLGERQALTLGAPLLSAALRQLVHQVEWGPLDVLLIDLPPGTGDLQQQLVGVVSIDGAVVVVGPQDVAHLDARRFVRFLRDADVRVLGAVENMSALDCPHCGERIEVFAPVTESRSVLAEGVSPLGSVPLDPALGTLEGPAGAQSEAFDAVAARLLDELQQRAAA